MKIRTYDGAVCEVDDELGKKLVALPGEQFKKVSAPRKKAPESPVETPESEE